MEQMLPLLAVGAGAIVVLWVVNKVLRHRWRDSPDRQFRLQVVMLALSLTALIGVIVALPINDDLRGQLLSLMGILLSAAIALASTTFIGNISATRYLTRKSAMCSGKRQSQAA